MTDPARKIRIVTGEEPVREDAYANQYMIGTKVNFWRDNDAAGPKYPNGTPVMESVDVTRIEHRVENRGDHAIGWFDVWAGEVLVASLNERHVAEVCYDLPEQVPAPA